MKLNYLALSALCLLSVFAEGPAVNQSAGPPPTAVQNIFDYAGGSNLVYTGYAMSDQLRETTIAVSAASNANPVSFTSTGHGINWQALVTASPSICITGGTGSWVGVNGCWVATPTSANAFTIAVDSSGFGPLAGTLAVTTRAPLTTKPVWSIQKIVYDAGGKVIWIGWASNPAGVGSTTPDTGSTSMRFVWDSRLTLGYQ